MTHEEERLISLVSDFSGNRKGLSVEGARAGQLTSALVDASETAEADALAALASDFSVNLDGLGEVLECTVVLSLLLADMSELSEGASFALPISSPLEESERILYALLGSVVFALSNIDPPVLHQTLGLEHGLLSFFRGAFSLLLRSTLSALGSASPRRFTPPRKLRLSTTGGNQA
jgi:hypothetical protein